MRRVRSRILARTAQRFVSASRVWDPKRCVRHFQFGPRSTALSDWMEAAAADARFKARARMLTFRNKVELKLQETCSGERAGSLGPRYVTFTFQKIGASNLSTSRTFFRNAVG